MLATSSVAHAQMSEQYHPRSCLRPAPATVDCGQMPQLCIHPPNPMLHTNTHTFHASAACYQYLVYGAQETDRMHQAAPSETYLSHHACFPHRKQPVTSASRSTSRAGKTETKSTEQNHRAYQRPVVAMVEWPSLHTVAYGDVEAAAQIGRRLFCT